MTIAYHYKSGDEPAARDAEHDACFHLADYNVDETCKLTTQPTPREKTSYFDLVDAVYQTELNCTYFKIDRNTAGQGVYFVLVKDRNQVGGGVMIKTALAANGPLFADLQPQEKVPTRADLADFRGLAKISGLVLTPNCRKSTYRLAMLNYLFAYCRTLGLDQIIASAFIRPARTDLLYLAHGFRKISPDLFNPTITATRAEKENNAVIVARSVHGIGR